MSRPDSTAREPLENQAEHEYSRAAGEERAGENLLMSVPPVGSLPEVSALSADRWVKVEEKGINVLCRSELASELIRIYHSHPWVHDALLARSDSTLFRGRRPVVAGTIAGEQVVVKRMVHGGMMTHIGRDAFLTASRAIAHVELADYLTAHGIPTAPVLFVGWRRVFGLTRSEIGFAQIPAAVDADRYFFQDTALPADWQSRAEDIGRLVAQLHGARFLHADLNLMNFLVGADGKTWVLDLDKTSIPKRHPTDEERERNLARLERSIRKQGRGHRPALVEGVVSTVRGSYRKSSGP